jgi:hypothetical protein
MIDTESAERALQRLRQSQAEYEDAVLDSKTATYRLKETEAIVVDELRAQKIPATLIPKLIWNDHRCIKAGETEAKASSRVAGINAQREADKTEISLYQSLVKDRM